MADWLREGLSRDVVGSADGTFVCTAEESLAWFESALNSEHRSLLNPLEPFAEMASRQPPPYDLSGFPNLNNILAVESVACPIFSLLELLTRGKVGHRAEVAAAYYDLGMPLESRRDYLLRTTPEMGVVSGKIRSLREQPALLWQRYYRPSLEQAGVLSTFVEQHLERYFLEPSHVGLSEPHTAKELPRVLSVRAAACRDLAEKGRHAQSCRSCGCGHGCLNAGVSPATIRILAWLRYFFPLEPLRPGREDTCRQCSVRVIEITWDGLCRSCAPDRPVRPNPPLEQRFLG